MSAACSPYAFWLGNIREREHLKYPGVDGRITLSCTGGWAWTRLICVSVGVTRVHLQNV